MVTITDHLHECKDPAILVAADNDVSGWVASHHRHVARQVPALAPKDVLPLEITLCVSWLKTNQIN